MEDSCTHIDGFDIFYMDCVGDVSNIRSDKFSTLVKVYYTLTPTGKEYITDFNPDAKLIPLIIPSKHED